MAFTYQNTKGETYYLNRQEVRNEDGQMETFYYFSLNERPKTACDVPEGYEVVELSAKRFPALRKKMQ